MEEKEELKGCAYMIFAFFAGMALLVWACKH